MDLSVYILFDIPSDASPHEILKKCKLYCSQWTMASVKKKLEHTMSEAEASVNAHDIFTEGEIYLKTSAAMLLDPSARQCYDAWLDAIKNPTPEKCKLTRSRLLWFNDTDSNVFFSDTMVKTLKSDVVAPPKKKRKRTCETNPVCRECRCSFAFDKPYLVLHCHCTTRVGHTKCIEDFSEKVGHKCPVCRQTLLRRHQVSKYLFWNIKERYKLIA